MSLGVLNLTYFCQYSAALMDMLLKISAGLDKSDGIQKRRHRLKETAALKLTCHPVCQSCQAAGE